MTMKTIRIDDEVWRALQKKATAFEDTPNSVLRRLLRIDGRGRGNRRTQRIERGKKTPQEAYREPILRALYAAGAAAKSSEILTAVEKMMGGRLNETDRRTTSSGAVRWRNTAQWARNALAKQGLIKRSSPHGIWELTGKGISAAEALL